MDEIRISEASELPEEFKNALERWKVRAEEILLSGEIEWYAKLASTIFEFDGKKYQICPEDVFSSEVFEKYEKKNMENVLHAGFEILQKTLTADLESLGAVNIRNFGFLD